MKKGKYRRVTKEQFIERAFAAHGDKYGYDKVDFIDIHTDIIITCPVHGDYLQKPVNHMKGSSCHECANKKRSSSIRKFYRASRNGITVPEIPLGTKAVPVGVSGEYSLVDEEDYDRLMICNWSKRTDGYAYNFKSGYMHRFILGVTDSSLVVDHVNHDRLDNRKSNLRLCTHQENIFNMKSITGASKYKGVSYDKTCNKWASEITKNYTKHRLGFFDNEIEAALAYDKKAKEIFGDFAYLNFPETEKQCSLEFHS